ncbi:MAG: porin family protein [Bacteroidales bacterium]|nr:porin family protein [Bacteroidales bacterium]
MKKAINLLLITLMLCAGTAMAGEPIRLGVVAGMNSSTLNSESYIARIGFNAGVKAEFGLPSAANGPYLSAAALISLKGAKVDLGPLGEITFNPYYLEIPIHVGYKYPVNDRLLFFADAGPYVACGLIGKIKADLVMTDDESENIFGNENLKRFDAGVGLRAGMELNRALQLSVGYDFGLTTVYDAEHYDGSEATAKNGNLSISLAYLFYTR